MNKLRFRLAMAALAAFTPPLAGQQKRIRRWGAGADAVLCRSVRRALFADRCVAGAAQGARRGRAAGVFRP